MNIVLDPLLLRRPRLEYVSPPICPILAAPSSSTAGNFILPVPTRAGPTAVLPPLIGCGIFLKWTVNDPFLGYVLYQAQPDGVTYLPVSDLIQPATISIVTAGFYEIAALTPNGETPLVGPYQCDGVSRLNIPLPHTVGVTGYNLYKNSAIDGSGTYEICLHNFYGVIVEVVTPTCYRLSGVSQDGSSLLSDPICVGPAQIQVTPSSLDFGTVTDGTTLDLLFTVANIGGLPFSGVASVPAGLFSIVSGANYTLLPGASQHVAVRYSPLAPETDSSTVSFTGGGGSQNAITGQGALPTCPPVASYPTIDWVPGGPIGNHQLAFDAVNRRIWCYRGPSDQGIDLVDTSTNAYLQFVPTPTAPISSDEFILDAPNIGSMLLAADSNIATEMSIVFYDKATFAAGTKVGTGVKTGGAPEFQVCYDKKRKRAYAVSLGGISSDIGRVDCDAQVFLDSHHYGAPAAFNFQQVTFADNADRAIVCCGDGSVSFWYYNPDTAVLTASALNIGIPETPWYLPEIGVLIMKAPGGIYFIDPSTDTLLQHLAGPPDILTASGIVGATYDICKNYVYLGLGNKLAWFDAGNSFNLVAFNNDSNFGVCFDKYSNYVYGQTPAAGQVRTY